ncbi:MAG: protein kinase [Chloroflexi bacterium]|nr:protein kinase [Chloroflexota bacterium]
MTYQPGEILLDKYRIEALIGRGAFAEVYRATIIKQSKPCALKVLHKDAPGLGNKLFEDFVQRFKLEVELGARIDHPNVVQVFGVEHHGDNLILVMEYASGGSLAERIKEHRESRKYFEIEDALKIAVDVATGLGELHSRDAVHRDLKPSNILFDDMGCAMIADFGLVQVRGLSMRSQISQPIAHPGTPGYMSPEQENIGNYLRPSSDVYTLGLVLFEMLTGRDYNYIEPGTKLSDVIDNVPSGLDKLITKLLAEKSENRPWNGKTAASMLERELSRIRNEREKRVKRELKEAEKRDRKKEKAKEHERLKAKRQAKRAYIWSRIKETLSQISRRTRIITGGLIIGGIVIASLLLSVVHQDIVPKSRTLTTE